MTAQGIYEYDVQPGSSKAKDLQVGPVSIKLLELRLALNVLLKV